MATETELEQLLGKAVLDSVFRRKLLEDPQKAASKVKIELSAAQAAAIGNLDPELIEWWAQGFETARGDVQGFLW